MNRERLERLEALLRRIAKRPRKLGFDLRTWKCGTAACAIGHAAMDPWFQKQGLILTGTSGDIEWPAYKRWTEFEAAAAFFGVKDNVAYELFGPAAYEDADLTNPLAVADRIRALLDGETR